MYWYYYYFGFRLVVYGMMLQWMQDPGLRWFFFSFHKPSGLWNLWVAIILELFASTKEQDARLCIHESFRNITLTLLAFLFNCPIQRDLTLGGI